MSSDNNEVMQEEVIIGARALGEQIYKIMPTYQVMLKQLEEIRQTAKEFEGKVRNQETKKQDINNTIGIFGPRGTGKSSALYTLREDLFKSEHNILLPLIEPDSFGENTKIIGSIVGLLQAEGSKLLKALEKPNQDVESELKKYYNNGTLKPNNPLKQIINETVEYHLYTERQYRNMLSHHYEDLANHIKKSSRLLIPDIAFRNKLNELINEIVSVKKQLNKSDETILIYIFIDDIDLKTSKTRELMDALLKCTDHPNIVTVLSGDYEILTESLTLALLADEPLKEMGLGAYDSLKVLEKNPNTNEYVRINIDGDFNTEKIKKITKVLKDVTQNKPESPLTMLGRKSGLAHEYLKKIIPPARRHQLVKWSEETIPSFAFGKATLLSQLAKLMGDQSVFSYKGKEKIVENGIEIERDAILPIKKSYTIFDERPRGIVNAYYHLVQLLKVIDSESKKGEKFSFVKVLIDTLILSNKKLMEHQELIFENFMLWGSDAKSSFIDYAIELSELDIELLIIGEITRYLLPEVKYDNLAFSELKNRLFGRLIHSKSDYENNKTLEIGKSLEMPYRLYHMMLGLAKNIDIRSGMLLLELISNHPFDSYYYEYTNEEGRDQKDRFAVLRVAELVRQYPYILEQLYKNSHIERDESANYTLNTLQDLCTVDPEFEKTERIYQGLLKKFTYNLGKNTKNFEEFKIRRELFTHTLTNIRKEKQKQKLLEVDSTDSTLLEGSLTIIAQDKFRSLVSALVRINKKLAENEKDKLPNSVFQTIETSINKFSEHMFEKIFKEDIKIDISISNADVFEKFLSGKSGVTETSIYANCKRYVYQGFAVEKVKDKYSFEMRHVVDLGVYKVIISNVESLARNNRVWYGQKEARDLLVALKNSSSILNNNSENNFHFFKGNEQYILEEYYEYITNVQEFLEDEEYEKAKRFVKGSMDAAYEEIRNRTAAELEEFNLRLEDAEDKDQETYGEANA